MCAEIAKFFVHECVSIYLLCGRGTLSRSKVGNAYPFMCGVTINVSLCDIIELESGEECDI